LTIENANLSPVWQRKLLFAALYFSEGAPIGFIWLAIPVQLRLAGFPVEKIAWLQAVLILPWALKFLWAPLVDQYRTRRWTLRHWVCAAQVAMGLTLVPLLWLDPVEHFDWLAAILLVHALAAATQDVSIDALCIATTVPADRGAYNGWMNVGMLLGRAALGGGLLAVYSYVGQTGGVLLLLAATFSSMLLLIATRLPAVGDDNLSPSLTALAAAFRRVLTSTITWWGVAFVMVAGAAFKSFDAIYGVYLVDRGISRTVIGSFTAGPVIGAQVAGSMLGGWLTDRLGPRRLVGISLLAIVALLALLAGYDMSVEGAVGRPLFVILVLVFVGIGVFTAGSYAMYMNLTQPGIAATQFSTFMGAVNGCESWSIYALGLMVAAWGYGPAIAVMCVVSLSALPLLTQMSPLRDAASDLA
jgi:MFS family permease